jgi:hypothetical protein
MTRRLFTAAYLLAIAALLGFTAAAWFIPLDSSWRGIAFFAIPVALLGGIGTLILLFPQQPNRQRVTGLAALTLGALLAASSRHVSALGRDLYFEANRQQLDALVTFVATSPITSLWDADPIWVSVNGTIALLTDSMPPREGLLATATVLPLTTVLQRNGIGRSSYDSTVTALRALNASQVTVSPERTSIGRRSGGFLYIRTSPGDSGYAPGASLGDMTILARYTPQWHYAGW